MAILEKLFILFIFTFPTGVIARFQFSNGVALSLNDLILAAVIVYWVIYRFKNNKFSNKYFLLKPICLFIFLACFSLLLNYFNLGINKFLISFAYLVRFLGYTLLYFVVKDFSNKFKTQITTYLLCSGLIVLILGYFQYFFYPSLKGIFYLGWDEHLYRMVSVFLDPNFAGAFFNIYLIFSLDYLKRNFKKLSNIKLVILSLISLFSLLAIYLTYSRSALVMLFITFAAYLILLNKKKLIIISILLFVLLIFISPRAFQTEGTNLLRAVSSSERIASLQVAAKIIQQHPIFGVGFNAYRYAQNKIGLNNKIWQITHSGAGTDNSFVFVLATTGTIGLIAYIYLIFSIFSLAKKNIKNNTFSLILFSSLLGLIFNSIFINSLFYIFIIQWIWILSGLTENS